MMFDFLQFEEVDSTVLRSRQLASKFVFICFVHEKVLFSFFVLFDLEEKWKFDMLKNRGVLG